MRNRGRKKPKQAEKDIRKIRRGRVSHLEKLLSTNQGIERYNEMIMAIENRCTIKAAAMMIGIYPNTLSNWLVRGKQEMEGMYRDLYDAVLSAVGNATALAELELMQTNPKFYLTRGMGRALLGDFYNHEPDNVTTHYTLDGSVTLDAHPLAVNHNEDTTPTAEAIEQRNNQADEQLMIEALAAMRDAGIDLNEKVDQMMRQNNLVESGDRHNDDESPVVDAGEPKRLSDG